jgi:Sap-like sulfolipid-1-addressing protein
MLWEAVPTALVAAFSPWTLLIVAGLLSTQRPVHRALLFLTAAAVTVLAIGFTVVLVLGASGLDDARKHRTVPPALDVALGLLVLAGALFFARRPPRDAKQAHRREAGLLAVIALGMVAGSPSPLYLTSLHSIAKGDPSTLTATVDILVIAVLVLLLAEVPIVMFLIAPQRCTAILDASNAWLGRHGQVIVVTAASVVGCYFVVKGVVRLV